MNRPVSNGGRRWDGSRYGSHTQRLLRLQPDTRSRALRAPQARLCGACGNHVEWYPRLEAPAVPLHPHELPVRQVPPALRWHVDQGVAHPYADGTDWCRVAHPALCPAQSADGPPGHRLGRLEALRRQLALRTRRLIDTDRLAAVGGLLDPQPAPAPCRDVVNLLQLLYLAPSPVEQVQCIAQSRGRDRCPRLLSVGWSVPWKSCPVPTAPRWPDPDSGLAETPMAVRDLTGLPYVEQLRWRLQRCELHAESSAADVTLPEWEPFDASAHRQHIHLRPAPQERGGE